ncbi:MAG: type II toxin-antitoxin system RelE/ParE family toxin [Xenococcus sp. (in: cyanobacteria)]
MARFVVTAEARKDLDEIWQYIAAESEIAADKVIAEIIQRFPRLAEFPEMGRERTELAAGMRSLTVGRYIIFYRPGKLGVAIVRVLHGSRDIEGLFP